MKPSRFWPSLPLLLTLVAPATSFAATYASIAKDGVNIRSGPSTSSEITWEVFQGFPVEVVERKGDWANTRDFEGDTGWIYAPLLSERRTVIVKVASGNLRVGPGTNYEVVVTVKYGVVFTPLERDGDWIKVQHADSTAGWIHKSLVWPAD
ncbi:MAG: SH3 domain-containing protein [Thermodesulfobacteriota bacterium]